MAVQIIGLGGWCVKALLLRGEQNAWAVEARNESGDHNRAGHMVRAWIFVQAQDWISIQGKDWILDRCVPSASMVHCYYQAL